MIYSCHSIFQIGVFFCVKKSFSNTTIVKTCSLDQVFETNAKFDLYILDVLYFNNLYHIKEQLVAFFKDKKVVFFVEDNDFEKFLEINDAVFLYKNSSEIEIIKKIKVLCRKGRPIFKNKSITKRIKNKINFSSREKECANLFMKGYSVSQISRELSLKINTVSTYKKRIHSKTNTNNLAQLIKTLYNLKE